MSECDQIGRCMRSEISQRWRLFEQVHAKHLPAARRLEGTAASQHLIQDDAKRVDIAAIINLTSATALLW